MRTEDGSIIQECLDGKPQAFGALVDKYKEGIYAFVYAELRDFQDAQDVTQEVFLQAYRDLRSLRRRESFVFWLYRIAYRRCVQWFRTRSRRVDRDFIEDQDPKVVDAPSLDSYRVSQLDESVREALDSLPDAYREVLVLHYFGYFGGLTIKDIARAIGASPAAIGMRLSRARAQMKEEMVAMTDTAFDGHRLSVGFTFRIVEAVKRIKIHPMPRVAGLPWGLSLAVGIIITVMSLNPKMSIPKDIAMLTGSPLPAEMKVLKTAEIPVDILKVSQVPALASMQGDGDGGKPDDPQETVAMVAQGEGDTWTTKTNMPTARYLLSTCVVDGKIYAIGGARNTNGPYFSTVEEYDPKTDTWTRKADLPEPRYLHAASVVDDKIHIIAGSAKEWTASPAVYEYDPATDTWERKADAPTQRAWLSASAVNGKIYVIGGNFSPPKETVEEYDPATDTWTKKADIPTPRGALSTSAVNGKIYAIGGTKTLHEAFSTVEVYDTGFLPPQEVSSVRPEGKLVTSWGKVKSR